MLTPAQEAKLDKLIEQQSKLATEVAVIQAKQDRLITDTEKNRSEIDRLKIWKYSTIASFFTAIGSLLK